MEFRLSLGPPLRATPLHLGFFRSPLSSLDLSGWCYLYSVPQGDILNIKFRQSIYMLSHIAASQSHHSDYVGPSPSSFEVIRVG